MQSRQEHDHVIAAHLPDTHDADGQLGPALIQQPFGRLRNANHSQQPVDDAGLTVEQPLPYKRHGHSGNNAGKEQGGAVDGGQPLHLLVEQYGKQQGYDQHKRNQYKNIIKRVPKVIPEKNIARKQIFIILQSDEMRIGQNIPVGE